MSPLARDIVVVLVVKALALGVLWLAFFRAPATEDAPLDRQHVERHVLAPHPPTPHALR